MKAIFAITALTLFSSLGFAHSSEMFYQPLDGQTLVEGNLILRTLDIGRENLLLPDQKLTDTSLNVRVERGFSDTYSGYMGLSYGSGTLDQDPLPDADFKGLGLIHIGGQYQRHADELGRFLGTIDLGIAIEDGDGDNRVQGQMVLTLGLGYEKHMSENLIGGYVSYGILATDFKVDGSPDSDADGNLNLKLYYERSVGESSMGPMIFAGKLEYEQSGFNYWQGSYESDSDFSSIILGAYTRVPMSEKFQMLASLDYRMSVSEPDLVEDATGFEISLGGRMLF